MAFNVNKYSSSGSATALDASKYSDFTINMRINPGSNDLVRVTDEEAVRNSLRNIILTNRYERLYNPLYGANLSALLFDLSGPADDVVIKKYIETAVSNYEPRVRIIDVVVTNVVDDHLYAITIIYSLLNKSDALTLDLKITRAR